MILELGLNPNWFSPIKEEEDYKILSCFFKYKFTNSGKSLFVKIFFRLIVRSCFWIPDLKMGITLPYFRSSRYTHLECKYYINSSSNCLNNQQCILKHQWKYVYCKVLDLVFSMIFKISLEERNKIKKMWVTEDTVQCLWSIHRRHAISHKILVEMFHYALARQNVTLISYGSDFL